MSAQSAIAPGERSLVPSFKLDGSQQESENTKAIIRKLNMQSHPEGGYFVVRTSTISSSSFERADTVKGNGS